MSKISNQLQELINQKKQLATNLNVKGISASEDETLNTLVPKVLSIVGGSGDVKLGSKQITEDGKYYAYEDGLDGYSSVNVNVLGGNADFIGEFDTESYSSTRLNIKTLSDVPDTAFQNVQVIGKLDLTKTKAIGTQGFYNSTQLREIIAPNKMTIGSNAFYGCGNAVGTIKISEEQTVIKAGTFRGCYKLRFELHDDITEVEQYAFYNCQSNNLTALPSKLTKIGNYAFWQNTGASGLGEGLNISEIPPLVTSIGTQAFQSNSFESIKIYDACITISAYAFRYNSLKSVEIGKGIVSIYAYAFGNNTQLTTFTIHATKPPTIYGTTFQSCNKLAEIRVPASALNVYKGASNWSKYADIMVGIEGE